MCHSNDYISQVRDLLQRLPMREVEEAVRLFANTYLEDRQVFLIGNGGSAATASHFACDLAKSTAYPGRRRLRVNALTDNVPLITAWANDVGYEDIFAEQLVNLLNPGDLVVAISGSGNSANVLKAVRLAAASRATTIGMTGFQGGKLRDLVDLCIIVPSDRMEHIEDVHLILEHLIATRLREVIFEQSNIPRPRRRDQRESTGPCKELDRVRVLAKHIRSTEGPQ